MKKILLAVLMLAAGAAHAADENARRDRNKFPTMLGVDSVNGETRRIRTNSLGQLETVPGAAILPPDAATETTLSAINTKIPAAPSTAGNQTTGNASLSSIDGKIPASPSTAGNQATGNTSLSSIDGKLPASAAADRTTAGAPSSVRLSDGTVFYKGTTPSDTQPISAASLPLPSGAATSANQTTANSSLSSIDGKFGSLGQKASAGSAPVVIASDQSDLPVALNLAGNDTATQGCPSVTTAAEVMAASASRESSLICNEGPGDARCGSGSVTTLIGQRLLADQCYTMDGPSKPFRGSISCISVAGPAVKICVVEGS